MYTQDKYLWQSRELSKSEKLLLLAIKFNIGGNDNSFVSQDTLAKETGLTRASVISITKRLEASGWLIVKRRRDDYATHIYSLPKDKFPPFKSKNCTPPVKSVDIPMYKDLTGGCITNLHKVYKPKIVNQEENQEEKPCAGDPAQNDKSQIKTENPGEIGETKPEHKSNSIATLESIWKSTIPIVYPENTFIREFTLKERSQLKKGFVNKISPNNAAKILESVLKNWTDFCIETRRAHGLSVIPEKPTIPFLVKYSNDAVKFYNAMIAPKITRVTQPTFLTERIPKIEDKAVIPEIKKKSNKMTLAELEEIEVKMKEIGLLKY